MKAVILAGGLGTRFSEETSNKPKPMIEIGGKPIIWHIMKTYSHYGINEFIICCGYKGYVIKEYFANYFLHNSDVTFDIVKNSIHVHHKYLEPWKVTLVDTGDQSMTGGRLKRVLPYIESEDLFCFTYGDGLINANIADLIAYHKRHGLLATVTGVYPPGRFGALDVGDQHFVNSFTEKPIGDGGMINGGYFVLSPKVIELISNDDTIWEKEPMQELARSRNLKVFEHTGFWQPMDTLRDKVHLEELWQTGSPWKVWDER
ncbi:glucose-1-phosphate cytidylyltransferase [Polynucleobacter sp. Nonnen-W13]|uniref:glucose-1-phosphate cytidylyltransferase n=1 Tax=Polynucleobacter sp. Nonnen-W13 TaxID=1855625 RepID=UPI001C0BBB67|nr:glucose-1-phosphate cytidylyltransferase [Polynucleobacter sp. Nonnen-W13]